MFAPVMPYVSEEVWSWWRDGSIHRAEWPSADLIRPAVDDPDSDDAGGAGDPLVFEVASAVLAAVRKAKSTRKVSLASPATRVRVVDTAERLAALDAARADVCDAGKIEELETEELGSGVGPESSVHVELPEPGQ
jgi:valyl-tRNA synthetase